MSRCIVNLATGDRFKLGQRRLIESFAGETLMTFDTIPGRWPSHRAVPYGFKAYALKAAAAQHDTLLWCDSVMVRGERPMVDLWEKIERDGYLIMHNAFTNYEWTAESAYGDLFPDLDASEARRVNKTISHVVGGFFGLDMRTTIAKAFLDELLRLAQTNAFCGPAINLNWRDARGMPHEYVKHSWASVARCGPSDVRGHRHDQTVMSVIAWRLGMKLSACPEWFSYEPGTDQTCVVAKGIPE